MVYLTERLQRRGCRVGVVCKPHCTLEDACRVRAIPCFPLAMRGELDILAGMRIARLCARHGFNILHLHTAHAATLGVWAKLVRPSLRLIAVRRVDFHIRSHPFSRWKYAVSPLDRVVCVSEAIRGVLVGDGVPSARLVTIRSGVDLDRFSSTPDATTLRNQLCIPSDHVVVGTVAAMAAHKDYPTLLAAADEAMRTEERVTFCAVGDGPQRERVHALAHRLGLGDRFKFVGFQAEVGPYLRLLDVFVLASRAEGLGTSVLDALAMGIPVVASRVGGIVEVVEDGGNGLLVPPGDPHALSEALCRIVHDTSLRERLAARARPSVAAFDIDITVQKNLQLYRELLEAQT